MKGFHTTKFFWNEWVGQSFLETFLQVSTLLSSSETSGVRWFSEYSKNVSTLLSSSETLGDDIYVYETEEFPHY